MNSLKVKLQDLHPMWHSSVLQATIACGGSLFLAFFFRNRLVGISISCLMMGLVAALTLVILYTVSNRTKPTVAIVTYFANVIACSLGTLINHHYWLELKVPFEGFFGFKIIAILIALQAPTIAWVGWSSLGFLFITPIVQYFFWSPEQQKLLGVQEPGFTAVVILSCGYIYFQRLKIFEMVQKQARLQASAAELRRFAHFLLGAQHLINSPLQVIETAVDLIRIKHPEAEPLVKKIENSFEPIRHVSRLLSFGRKHLNWDEVNIALTVEDLEREIKKISGDTAGGKIDQY